MKIGLAVIALLLSLGADIAAARPGGVWRVGAQECFLPPDVAVAINALGPYCASPRGRPYRITHADRYRPYYWPYYGPYHYRSFLYRSFLAGTGVLAIIDTISQVLPFTFRERARLWDLNPCAPHLGYTHRNLLWGQYASVLVTITDSGENDFSKVSTGRASCQRSARPAPTRLPLESAEVAGGSVSVAPLPAEAAPRKSLSIIIRPSKIG